ncbi:PQQ-binding-like beta-propeller repeat protein [Cellulomonas sp. SLBN-39]|uniref:outer membrane protein assembly factor BamB family protein n=1 Tax=Cellulomonas sp. SLBN-39 TaxID=2768446 RepID=UPI0011511388|nr:PQQ-binding-like beta-propeller repeat protein [Cellulomonas sp. SLBN-39]TQL01452.1 putative pyrroloquinoline-quinone binding quinoprotein [Cellulomonas sp. SLBN-39]
MGAKQRHEVELDEGPDDEGGDDPFDDEPDDDAPGGRGVPGHGAPQAGRARRWTSRRRLLGGVGAVAVVGLLLVGAQLVVDSGERARLAALAGLPGVVHDLAAPPRLTPDDLRDAGEPVVEQELVADDGTGPRVVLRASQDVVRLDGDDPDGSPGWTVVLWAAGDPPAEDTDGWVPFQPSCVPTPDDASIVTCLIGDGAVSLDGDGTDVPQTWARLLAVDVVDGATRYERDLDLPAPARLQGAGGVLVGGTRVPDGDDGDPVDVVTAFDAATGAERWVARVPVPDVLDGYVGQAELAVTPDVVAVRGTAEVTVLSTADGTVLRGPDGARLDGVLASPGRPDDAELLVLGTGTGASARTTLWSPDGEVVVGGQAVVPSVDDGSADGLVLTTQDGDLHGWERDGTPRWRAPGVDGESGMVVDGRVVVMVGTTLRCVDGDSGRVLWEVPVDEGMLLSLTDGRRVVLQQAGWVSSQVDGATATELVAVDLADGDEAWRTTLAGVGWVDVVGGRLLAFADDGAVLTFGADGRPVR